MLQPTALAVLYACPLPAVHAEGSFIAALNRDGSKHMGDYYLYGYVLPLDASKTVESLTLPHNQDDVVLAVTLSP